MVIAQRLRQELTVITLKSFLGYWAAVTFDGGIGINSQINILRALGLNPKHISGKMYDYLEYDRINQGDGE